jgi:hypothetical protein
MNQQNNGETNEQQSLIEDLTVNDDQTAEIKGGRDYSAVVFVGGWGG